MLGYDIAMGQIKIRKKLLPAECEPVYSLNRSRYCTTRLRVQLGGWLLEVVFKLHAPRRTLCLTDFDQIIRIARQ